MTSFLDNPEQEIVEKFTRRAHGTLSASNDPSKLANSKALHRKKKEHPKNAVREDRTNEKSVQIRVSVSVEQQVKDALLSYYKATGNKINMRQYADAALLAYIEKIQMK